MHKNFTRRKKRVLLLSLAYRIWRLLRVPFSRRAQLRFLLDLQWIVNRLSHEASFRFYPKDAHPALLSTADFLGTRLKPGARILDLGCGRGELAYILAQRGFRVLGVDRQESLIEEGKAMFRSGSLELRCGDLRDFTGRSAEPYDLLLLSHVIEHLEHPVEFLKGVAKEFRCIFVEVPEYDDSYRNIYRNEVGSALLYRDSDHLVEFDRDHLLGLLRSSGLEVNEWESRFGVLRAWCSSGVR